MAGITISAPPPNKRLINNLWEMRTRFVGNGAQLCVRAAGSRVKRYTRKEYVNALYSIVMAGGIVLAVGLSAAMADKVVAEMRANGQVVSKYCEEA